MSDTKFIETINYYYFIDNKFIEFIFFNLLQFIITGRTFETGNAVSS